MSSDTHTRMVGGFAPFVERALDSRDAFEALGGPESSGDEPRGDGGQVQWEAARYAHQRINAND